MDPTIKKNLQAPVLPKKDVVSGNSMDTVVSIISDNIGNLFSNKKDYKPYLYLMFTHLISILFFAILYYILLLDFDANFFSPSGYKNEYFMYNKIYIALIISLNFQTTVAYVDIKCKNIFSRIVISLQTCITFIITFLFIL